MVRGISNIVDPWLIVSEVFGVVPLGSLLLTFAMQASVASRDKDFAGMVCSIRFSPWVRLRIRNARTSGIAEGSMLDDWKQATKP